MIIYLISHSFESLGSVAFRVNCFCSLCTAVAAFFMGKIVMHYSRGCMGASLFAMGLFSFSPLIWTYATTSEVFPLNTAFASVILYLVVSFSSTGSLRTACLGALLCGLALCNQHTILLLEAPLVLWMLFLLRRRILQRPSVLALLAGCFLLGLLPYIYLPLAASFNPRPGSWGDASSLAGFLHHLLRRDYGTFQLFSGAAGKSAEGFWARNEAYLRDLLQVQGGNPQGLLLLLAALGALDMLARAVPYASFSFKDASASASRRNLATTSAKKKGKGRGVSDEQQAKSKAKTAAPAAETGSQEEEASEAAQREASCTPAVLVLVLLFYFCVFHSLSNLPLRDPLLYGVHQRFWMQPNILAFALAGLGFAATVRLASVALTSGGSVGRGVERALSAASVALALYCTYAQYARWLPLLDMSGDGGFFRDYAAAVLSPLPPGALLFVNYDQQWTSVRYLQVCEKVRPDVTAIQLSMATYQWFQTKRHLYPHLDFPGTYHTYPGSPAHKQGAFTLKQFLDANARTDQQVFLGGQLSYQDQQLLQSYEMVPVGLVSRFVPADQPLNSSAYTSLTGAAWATVAQSLSVHALPPISKFPQETWEWTIGRDLKDRIIDTAAYMLQKALETETEPLPLVQAVYWMEAALRIEGLPSGSRNGSHVPAHLLKNAGLAHLHLVRNALLSTQTQLPLPPYDSFQLLERKELDWPSTDWKLWSSNRFAFCWGHFLQHPDASRDSQYAAIKGMYETATQKVKR